MFWNEEGGGWKEGGCLAFAYRDDTSVQKGRNPEKKKIYIYTVYRIKKGKEQHAIKSLFTWLSGLQLQPDPLLPPPSQNLNSFSLFYFHLLMAY
jgi:hypothetical protein